DPVRGNLANPEAHHRTRDDGDQRAGARLRTSGRREVSAEERLQGSPSAGAPDRREGVPAVVGVLGAGTMGAGIAPVAARAGARTLPYDPVPDALAHGLERAREGLGKEAARRRLTSEQAHAAGERLRAVDSLAELAPCELVIEAAPERLELKH